MGIEREISRRFFLLSEVLNSYLLQIKKIISRIVSGCIGQ